MLGRLDPRAHARAESGQHGQLGQHTAAPCGTARFTGTNNAGRALRTQRGSSVTVACYAAGAGARPVSDTLV